MRKILTILALFCLLFLVGGYHLLYQYRLAEVRAVMKKDLLNARRAELTQLVFAATDFASLEWEGSTEFRYQNTMYDVVEVEKNGDKTVCWCLPDKKETALIDQFLKTQIPSDKESSQSLAKLLQAPFLPVSLLTEDVSFCDYAAPFSFYSLTIPAPYSFILTPPPKVC